MTGRHLGRHRDRHLGLDVGGTKCLVVVVADDGSVITTARQPTPTGVDALVDTLCGLVAEAQTALDGERPETIGVGVPGLVGNGIIRTSPHLPGVIDFDVAGALEARLGRPVAVDNDATCAALAEWRVGAGRSLASPDAAGQVEGAAPGAVTDAVVVTLGTGIGAGMIAGGALQHGANGFAGEVGHMVIEANGVPCPCGRRGCWERYASGTALGRLATEAARAGRLPAAGSADVDAVRGEDLATWARSGDDAARAVFDEFAEWLGLGLANLTAIADPQLFVIGGGLSSAADLFLPATRDALARLQFGGERRPTPRIVAAQLGELAGGIGAALLGAQPR